MRCERPVFTLPLRKVPLYTQATICRFENGKKNLRPKTIAKIEAALADVLASQQMLAKLRVESLGPVGALRQRLKTTKAGGEETDSAPINNFFWRGGDRDLYAQNADLRDQN